ncbi:Ubiquitin-like modifier-activating enzyme atg7 [Cymbomonas tetramitiformis]|uniref:Autophagy protein 5 n=1 Tax=Cymbomonas tetramitiformis TaxID=36881 RepID=A0AAE0H4K4_9CHLO|nr:Ubiquitin-like modifier-activating enzyme atg7 [Cymbomonas tetramitiformis]
MTDKELRNELWTGAIPIRLTLVDNEIATMSPPEQMYVMAPRMGYLQTLATQAYEHFQEFLPPGDTRFWLDYEGLPLKWSIPTGVLYDLLAKKRDLPWELTVHFRTFPDEVLLKCNDSQTVRAHFYNSLKEAMYIMYGSAGSVMQLSQQVQTQLWKSIEDGMDMETYDTSTSTLPSSTTQPNKSIRAVPVRMYLMGDKRVASDDPQVGFASMSMTWDHIVCSSRPVPSVDAVNGCGSLGNLLQKVLPELFAAEEKETNEVNVSVSQVPSSMDADTLADAIRTHLSVTSVEGMVLDTARGTASMTVKSMHRSRDEICQQISEGACELELATCKLLLESPVVEQTLVSQAEVWIQGMQLPLSTPLEWLCTNLRHPDCFVHLIVRMPCRLL